MVLNDPDGGEENISDLLQQLYGLTQAEARIASALANGEGTAAISEKFQISQNTIKTHRSRVYAKMDVSKQAELVRVAKGLVSG